MEVMINVNPLYTDTIFSGYKQCLFEYGAKATQDITDDTTAYICEKDTVVGTVRIDGIFNVMYATPTEHSTELVKERFACIKSLYLRWCFMKRISPNMNEGWFKSKKFIEYRATIGFKEQNFDQVLMLSNPVRYEIKKELHCFVDAKGEPLVKSPDSICQVTLKLK